MCFLSFHVYHIKAQAQGKSMYLFLWNGQDFSCSNRADYKTKKTFEQGLKSGNRCMLTQTVISSSKSRLVPQLDQTVNEQTTKVWIGLFLEHFSAVILE